MQKNRPDNQLFDRRALRQRRGRAMAGGGDGFLLQLVVDELKDRLQLNRLHFELALCLGDPSPSLARAMMQSGKTATVISGDLCHMASPPGREMQLVADEQALPFRQGVFNLIVSALGLQWANDLPGTLARLRRALKPGGLFLGAMSGGRTLIELRTALQAAEQACEGGISPRVSPVADLRQMGDLLHRAGFISPVADLDQRVLRYDNALQLMRDLRAMGATNVLSARRKTPLRPKTLTYAVDYYQEHFADPDGRVRASFEFIYLNGWQTPPA